MNVVAGRRVYANLPITPNFSAAHPIVADPEKQPVGVACALMNARQLPRSKIELSDDRSVGEAGKSGFGAESADRDRRHTRRRPAQPRRQARCGNPPYALQPSRARQHLVRSSCSLERFDHRSNHACIGSPADLHCHSVNLQLDRTCLRTSPLLQPVSWRYWIIGKSYLDHGGDERRQYPSHHGPGGRIDRCFRQFAGTDRLAG